MAGVYLLHSRGATIVEMLEQLMRDAFVGLPQQDLMLVTLRSKGLALALLVMKVLAPVIVGVMATGVLSTVVQTKGLVAPALLKPNLKRLNPIATAGQLASWRGLVESLKGIGKMAIVGLIIFEFLTGRMMAVAAASTAGPLNGVEVLGSTIYQMAFRVALLFLTIGLLDYVFQWRQFQQSIRMTPEEVKEDLKSAEGSPLLKARLRQMQRQWARQRMMQEVPKADVVVTNPTHLAIALKYDGQTMLAPTVVAKGKGVVAAQIVKVARRHRVPVVENRPLAHALIRLDIGAQIPPTLYQAVAEVLAFVYRLRRARAF